MTNEYDVNHLIGRTAIDSTGEKVGKVGQVYLDDETGRPAWVAISTGMFGTRQSFAPLQGMPDAAGDDLVLGVTKEQIKGAPSVDDDGHIDETEQAALYDYYE